MCGLWSPNERTACRLVDWLIVLPGNRCTCPIIHIMLNRMVDRLDVGTYIRTYVGRSIYIQRSAAIYIHTCARAYVHVYLPTYAPPQQKAKNFHAFIQNAYPPPRFWSVFVWWVLTSNGYITHYPRICDPRKKMLEFVEKPDLVSVCAELMLHAKLLQPSRSKGFIVFSVKMLTFLPIINKKKN